MPGESELPKKPVNRRLVLIAEDEGPIAEALTLIVEDAGYTPIVASHGVEALEIARREHPALLITDLMMPLLSGAGLIQALREDAEHDGMPTIPMVLLTAAGGQLARAANADVLVRKPFDIAEIEALLRRYLGPPDAADGG